MQAAQKRSMTPTRRCSELKERVWGGEMGRRVGRGKRRRRRKKDVKKKKNKMKPDIKGQCS